MHLYLVLMATIRQPSRLLTVRFVLLGRSVQTKPLLLRTVMMDFIRTKVKCCVMYVLTATNVKLETQSPVTLGSILRTENARPVLKTITVQIPVQSLSVQWDRHRIIRLVLLVRLNVSYVQQAFTAMGIRKHHARKDISVRREVISPICVHRERMLVLKSLLVIRVQLENAVL